VGEKRRSKKKKKYANYGIQNLSQQRLSFQSQEFDTLPWYKKKAHKRGNLDEWNIVVFGTSWSKYAQKRDGGIRN